MRKAKKAGSRLQKRLHTQNLDEKGIIIIISNACATSSTATVYAADSKKWYIMVAHQLRIFYFFVEIYFCYWNTFSGFSSGYTS